MNQKGYICQGKCQGFVTEEEYLNGLTVCGTEGCDLKGKPFVKGFKCHVCEKVFPEGTLHQH